MTNLHRFRWEVLFWLFLACAIAACHAAPPVEIEGAFIADDNGSNLLFSRGKVVSATRNRNGTYTLDGSHIILTRNDGTRFEGERISADHLRMRMRDDAPVFDVDLYRQNSAEADAILKRLGLPTAAKPMPVAVGPLLSGSAQPNPNLPISSYRALADGHDIGVLVAAWSSPPVPDAELLSELVDGYSAEGDTFKKHDIAAHALPQLQQAIAADRGQRAITVRGGVMFPAAQLGHFDFTAHAFPLTLTVQPRSTEHDCWYHWAVGSGRLDTVIATSALPCAIQVPDESVARKIEATYGHSTLHLGGTLALWVVGPPDPQGNLPTVLVHAHLRITDRNDPSLRYELDL